MAALYEKNPDYKNVKHGIKILLLFVKEEETVAQSRPSVCYAAIYPYNSSAGP